MLALRSRRPDDDQMTVQQDQADGSADAAFGRIERENQLILRAAGEGIYGVNAEGKTTFVNPAAERMLGWTRRRTGRA